MATQRELRLKAQSLSNFQRSVYAVPLRAIMEEIVAKQTQDFIDGLPASEEDRQEVLVGRKIINAIFTDPNA